jgi:hypothetical protein
MLRNSKEKCASTLRNAYGKVSLHITDSLKYSTPTRYLAPKGKYAARYLAFQDKYVSTLHVPNASEKVRYHITYTVAPKEKYTSMLPRTSGKVR